MDASIYTINCMWSAGNVDDLCSSSILSFQDGKPAITHRLCRPCSRSQGHKNCNHMHVGTASLLSSTLFLSQGYIQGKICTGQSACKQTCMRIIRIMKCVPDA